MNNKPIIFIISLKNSKRLRKITNRLNDINVEYRVINGIDGNKVNKKNKLHLYYDKYKTIKNIGREFHPAEVGGCASHLKIYRYICRNNIKNAIIMEDDAYPSSYIYDWVEAGVEIEDNLILGFYGYPAGGLIEKKIYKNFSNLDVTINLASTQICNCSCYQINIETCKNILSLNGKKVNNFGDWPFSRIKHKIKIGVTLPFMAIIDDENTTSLSSLRSQILKKGLYYRLSNVSFFGFLLPAFKELYYILFIPFLFGKYKNIYFYYERFVEKRIKNFLNYFSKNHYNIDKIYYDPKFYKEDISKLIK
jgi:hypothetical protein